MERAWLADQPGSGRSTEAIARDVGRDPSTVGYWVRKHGLASQHAARHAARGGLEREVLELCRRQRVADRRRRVKEILVAEAGGRCALCGYDRCVRALHFHHNDPGGKAFGLALRGIARSLERSRAEARKCTLLCANCHAEVEAGLARLPFAANTAAPLRD